jgi:hypothetical protein
MKPGTERWGVWVAAALLVLVTCRAGSAAGPGTVCSRDYCAVPSYSPCHYWAPTWYRLRAYCNPPALSLYAAGPPTSAPAPQHVIGFPCPAAPPAAVVETRRILP